MRECKCCGQTKPLEKFGYSYSGHGEKKAYHKHRCYSCTNRKRRFKISYDELAELVSITHCEICNEELNDGRHGLSIDHCHETGEIRGVLCGSCNLILGHAKDNISILSNSIKYLNESKSK